MYSVLFGATVSGGTYGGSTAPRYAPPAFDELVEREPVGGMCVNCLHRIEITLGGERYQLCVQERDDSDNEHPTGEVYECDLGETECADWLWDGDDFNDGKDRWAWEMR